MTTRDDGLAQPDASKWFNTDLTDILNERDRMLVERIFGTPKERCEMEILKQIRKLTEHP